MIKLQIIVEINLEFIDMLIQIFYLCLPAASGTFFFYIEEHDIIDELTEYLRFKYS